MEIRSNSIVPQRNVETSGVKANNENLESASSGDVFTREDRVQIVKDGDRTILLGSNHKDRLFFREGKRGSVEIDVYEDSEFKRMSFTKKEAENLTIDLGEGDNWIEYGFHANTKLNIIAGDGKNFISGAAGSNTIKVGNGDNVIMSHDGNDFIVAGNGKNKIDSEDGNDVVIAGRGDNMIFTDNGADVVIAGGINLLSLGSKYFSTQQLLQSVDMISVGEDTLISTATKTQTPADPNTSEPQKSPKLVRYADRIILNGTGGDDKFTIRQSLLKGNVDISVLNGDQEKTFSLTKKEAKNLIINLGEGNNSLETIGKVKTGLNIVAGDGNNTIITSQGSDKIKIGNGNNLISTDKGNDFIVAGNGSNEIRGGQGNDVIMSGSGDNKIYGGSGADTIVASNAKAVSLENEQLHSVEINKNNSILSVGKDKVIYKD